jgi:pimeloyl-ACP methyl ester carboxylesterase
VKALLPRAALVSLDDLGHLAHEERPEAIGRLIVEFASSTGLLVAPTIEG